MLEALFILLLVASGQGLFLAIFLVAQWRKNKANLFLGFIFLFFSLQLFDLVLLSSSKALEYPHLAFWSTPLNLAFGPLLYLFIKGHQKDSKPSGRQLLHFIPFLFHAAYVSWVYHFHSLAYKQEFIQQYLTDLMQLDGPPTTTSEMLFGLLIYSQFALYLWLSKRHLSKTELFSNDNLRLLKPLWWALLIIGLFGLVQLALFLVNVQPMPATGYIASFLAVLYIYSGALIVFKRPEIIFPAETKAKYQYSNLNAQASFQLIDQLKKHMQEAKPYLDQEFNLRQLSKELGTSDRHISQAINEQLGQNFSDFVNLYRIQEFKSELSNPDNRHLSLLGIAMECGFNSKSTFNAAFKKSTGLTPSQYKDSIG